MSESKTVCPQPTEDAYDGTQAKMLAAHHAAKQLKLTSKSKNIILERYEHLYGENTTAKIKGKDKLYPTRHQLAQESTMKPAFDKQYRVLDLSFYNVIVIVLGHFGGLILPEEFVNLALMNTTLFLVIPEILRLLAMDFLHLLEPRLDYEDQVEVCPHRIDMSAAAMIHTGLDPGMFVRMMGLEYTAANRPRERIFADLQPRIDPNDYEHIVHILTYGTPSIFNVEETT